MSLFYAFFSITALFVIIVFLKKWRPNNICAICSAVTLTWAGLLAMYHLGDFNNSTLLALLMGGSVVAGYYVFDRKAPEGLLLFRLPVLLSLFYAAYTAITLDFNLIAAILVVALWVVLAIANHYRNNPKLKATVKRIIECCSKW